MAKKVQKNYEELKKKSELTESFIRLADQIQIDDKDVPKTEKGMNTKAKELLELLGKSEAMSKKDIAVELDAILKDAEKSAVDKDIQKLKATLIKYKIDTNNVSQSTMKLSDKEAEQALQSVLKLGV